MLLLFQILKKKVIPGRAGMRGLRNSTARPPRETERRNSAVLRLLALIAVNATEIFELYGSRTLGSSRQERSSGFSRS
jgi:hypothetical protein